MIRKGVGRKSKKNVVVVEMRIPAGKNNYGTIEATFYAENILQERGQYENKSTAGKRGKYGTHKRFL